MKKSNNRSFFHDNSGKKIKVLQVVNSLKIGGAELLLKNFSIEAKKNNQFTVDICTLFSTNDSGNIEELKNKNVHIRSFNLKNKYSLASIGKIKEILERENYDIVHVHLFPASAIVALSSILIKKNIIFLFTVHSTFNKRRNIKMFKIIDALIYHRYKKIICISRQVKNSLIEWVPGIKEKIEIIPNGIPIDVQYNDNSVRRKYDVLFVGRLVKEKGINYLLKAIDIIQKKYQKNIRVAIAGNGPMKTELVKMCEELKIRDSVEFLGFQRDIDSIMRFSRILVLPSIWEGFGLVLLEAMKNRCAIIASNVGGIPEIITSGNDGLLIPKENSKILAHSIHLVLENAELRKLYTQNAYKKVQNNYSIEKYANKMFELYFKMMNNTF